MIHCLEGDPPRRRSKSWQPGLRGLVRLSPLLVVWGLAAACGAYRLGTTLPPHLRTVYIPTFVNETFEPGIEADITDQVITGFRRDGNLQPVSEEEADATLTGKITGWNRRVLGYTGADENTVEEYRLYVTAVIVFQERPGGEKLIRGQSIQGYADFYLDGDLASAEEAARPRAFQDLARNIVDSVVSIW